MGKIRKNHWIAPSRCLTSALLMYNMLADVIIYDADEVMKMIIDSLRYSTRHWTDELVLRPRGEGACLYLRFQKKN